VAVEAGLLDGGDDLVGAVLVGALGPDSLARGEGDGAVETRCISMRRSCAFQTARWSKAERSKSASSSVLIRASRFLLKAAVTPSGSS
jgi:hypothetical protein